LAESKRVLDPGNRLVEALCGLIIVLTFTLTANVSLRENVHSMLVATLGCALAWGIVDGIMYLMTNLSDRRTGISAYKAARKTNEPAEAEAIISDALPASLAAALEPGDFERMWRRLKELPEPPEGPRLTKRDWLGATGVALLVFASTLPVAAPFALLKDPQTARRMSNVVAVAMLFIMGYWYGRCVAYRPVRLGLAMVLFGGALVAVTVALGG